MNALEELKKGNINFITNLLPSDKDVLIELIRTDANKINIIDSFIGKLKDIDPNFCFDIIYDMQEYEDISYELLKNKCIDDISLSKIINMLYKTRYGIKFLNDNFDYFMNREDEIIESISVYLLSNYENNKDLVFRISRYYNLHTRYLFMRMLIKNFNSMYNQIYDDITKYLTTNIDDKDGQMTLLIKMMDEEEVCNLAMEFARLKDMKRFNKLKKYILKNYDTNSLGEVLRKQKIDVKNADDLFIKSKNKLYIYENYAKKMSEELVLSFENKIGPIYNASNHKTGINIAYEYGLGDKLENYIDKYLSLSKTKETYYIGSGTTTECFRLGDYVIKLSDFKWSYEDVICPNLYLIAKNYEEDYVRDSSGKVLASIEVQKYLEKIPDNIPNYIELYKEELGKLGYYCNDLVHDPATGSIDDNLRLLDDYKDADTDDIELLPEWFKKNPLVLIDRDMVHKVGKEPKCLKIRY
ncbi:MAG: hypothetical protein IJ565_06565 [Bacilli bacterium]|nr:hypothetical protein [Bacilli bacterium]